MSDPNRDRTRPARAARGGVILEAAGTAPAAGGAVLLDELLDLEVDEHQEVDDHLEPDVPAAAPVDVRAALERALEGADHLDEQLDAAAVELARRLADDLDDLDLDGKRLAPVARTYLEALDRLHLTAAARSTGDAPAVAASGDPLGELRDRSARRLEALEGGAS